MCSPKISFGAALLGLCLATPLTGFSAPPGQDGKESTPKSSPTGRDANLEAYGIDGFSPGDEVSRETRQRLESFKRDVDSDGITYTKSALSMKRHYLIQFKAVASRSEADQPPTLHRVERVVLAWSKATPQILMDDAKLRHGESPSCSRMTSESEANKTSGLSLLLKTLSHARILDLPEGWSGDASTPVSGEVCIWGDARQQEDSQVACNGKCLAVSVSRPVKGVALTRMTEIALQPKNGSGDHSNQSALLDVLGR